MMLTTEILSPRVASMILCHDKPKKRANSIARFVLIARELREMNNYSGLRSVLAGIGASGGPDDPAMKLFKSTQPDLHKTFSGYNLLLTPNKSHQTYRLALRQTTGPCIPAV
jgi:hypothetical protein